MIVYSAYADPMFESAARGLGAVDYVVKGSAPDDLLDRLKRLCRQAAAPG
jgi:DNA-binding response OmpR family regulator